MPWSSRGKPPTPRSSAIVRAEEEYVVAALARLRALALAWDSPEGLRAVDRRRRLPGRRAGGRGERTAAADAGRARIRRWSRPGSTRSPRPRGRCSTTSSPTAARRPRARPAGTYVPRTPPARRRSCSPAGCWSPAATTCSWCPARSGSRCAAGAPRPSRSTGRPRWRARTGRPDSPRARPPARPGSSAGGPSCCSSGGAPGRRPRSARAGSAYGSSRRPRSTCTCRDPDTALVIETASGAGLIATRADADGNPVWVPTDAYDAWLDADARRALDHARAGLARQHPAPRPRRRPRGRRQAVERAHPRALLPADARDPHDDARRARRGPGGLGAGVGHRAAVAGGPAGLAASAATALARRPGGVDGRRGGDAGRDRPGRAVAVRPGADRRRGPGSPARRRCCRNRSTTC